MFARRIAEAAVSGLRLLVVGAAANAWPMHARAIAAIDARVVGVFDTRHDAALERAAELGCPAAPSLDELLAIDADVAVILAPHPAHAELAITCLGAGLHVLCEKPLSDNVLDGDRMVEAARHSRRLLAVALQQRTRSEVIHAQRLIADGAIGRIRHLGVLATWPRRHSYFATAEWRGTWRGEGGGILINQAQHDLDLTCLLAGSPASVVGRTSNAFHGRETEDTATALLAWPSGATGTLHVSTAEDDEPQRIEIVGSAGRLRLSPGRLEIWRAASDMSDWAAEPGDPYERPATSPPEVHTGRGGTHQEVYQNLVEALEGRTPLVASAEAALGAVELANAISYSSSIGREIALPLDRAAYGQLLEQLRGPSPAALPSVLR